MSLYPKSSLLLALLTVMPVHALQPRWTPPKSTSIKAIDPAFFNPDRIQLKFREGTQVRLREERLVSLSGIDLTNFTDCLSTYKIKSIERLFKQPEATLDAMKASGEARSGKLLADLNNWYRVVLDASEAPESFIEALLELEIIEDAHANPLPFLTEDFDPPTESFGEGQGYLGDAPVGIDAGAAWAEDGGRGEGVRIIDVEFAWTWGHEDFKQPFFHHQQNAQAYSDHGDAVMGILIGQHNDYGIDGLCPGAEVGGYSALEDYEGDYPNISASLAGAIAQLTAGDIYLIELSVQYEGNLVPMEVWQENFDVIETASANGIICVQAAGNGSADLDHDRYEGRFDPDNRHSGAILVGGANPNEGGHGDGWACAEFSNYGSRVDLQGWGYGIVTTGYGDLFFPNNDRRQWYTSDFGGTSGATAIVAGAVACVQGMVKAEYGEERVLSPEEMRDVLVATGTPQQGDRHVGPLPDLREAIRVVLPLPCTMSGLVSDATTGQPIVGAEVVTSYGLMAVTNDFGEWVMEDAHAEIEFSLTAAKIGYNPLTVDSLMVEENSAIEVNFQLLNPQIVISQQDIIAEVEHGDQLRVPFRITNGGNGPLDWSASRRLVGNAIAEPGTIRRSLEVGWFLEDSRIEGAVFVREHFYLSDDNDGSPTIYVLNRNMQVIAELPQHNPRRFGYKDLDWDGERIWACGGSEPAMVYAFTPECELVDSFPDPNQPSNSIACDLRDGSFYFASTTGAFVRTDSDGNVTDRRQLNLRIYGLAYNPVDPDGFYLYIVNRPAGDAPAQVTRMNPETGETMPFSEFRRDDGTNYQQGAFITNELDNMSWTLLTMQTLPGNDHSDKLDVVQLSPFDDWLEFEPTAGTLEPEQSEEIVLMFNSDDLALAEYEGEILFEQGVGDGEVVMPVSIQVTALPMPEFAMLSPEDMDTLVSLPDEGQGYPLFGATQFVWGRVAYENPVFYRIQISNPRGGRWSQMVGNDTTLTVNLDTLGLNISGESELIWGVSAHSGVEIVSADLFRLNMLPNGVPGEMTALPTEVSLGNLYPNPFNSTLRIEYGLPKEAMVTLAIYDASGRLVITILDNTAEAGWHNAVWSGVAEANGVYFLRLEAEGVSRMQKVLLVK